jgi:hypothetical protein
MNLPGRSLRINPPFFEFCNPILAVVDPVNDNQNEDGGVKVDIYSGKELKVPEIKKEVPQPTKKKSFLRLVK